MKISYIIEETKSISSNIKNAYIDFSKMTISVVAVCCNVVKNGKPLIGYGFNSNGRYGQGHLSERDLLQDYWKLIQKKF